jgi:hypothetical protein
LPCSLEPGGSPFTGTSMPRILVTSVSWNEIDIGGAFGLSVEIDQPERHSSTTLPPPASGNFLCAGAGSAARAVTPKATRARPNTIFRIGDIATLPVGANQTKRLTRFSRYS